MRNAAAWFLRQVLETILQNSEKSKNLVSKMAFISLAVVVIFVAKAQGNFQSTGNYVAQIGCSWNNRSTFHEEYVTTRLKCATKCTLNSRCVSANVIPEGDRLKCQYFDDFIEDLDNLECGQDGHYYMSKGIYSISFAR